MDEDGIAGCVGCIVLIVIIVIAAPVLSFLSEAITSVFNFAGDVIAFIESAIAFTAAFLTGLGTVTIGSALLIGVLAGTSAVVRLVSPVNNRKRGYTNLAREHKHKANPKAIQEQSAVEHKADSGRVTEAEQRAQVFREAQRKLRPNVSSSWIAMPNSDERQWYYLLEVQQPNGNLPLRLILQKLKTPDKLSTPPPNGDSRKLIQSNLTESFKTSSTESTSCVLEVRT